MQAFSEEQKLGRWRDSNLWFLAAFYFLQGFYFYGSGIYLVTSMANWEVPAKTQATVIAVIGLPSYLQMLPGLLSDRLPLGRWGRRKPYIFLGALIYPFGFAWLMANQQFGVGWVGGLLVTLLAWSLVDSALDGLTIDITPQQFAARVQGAARSGRMVGMALTSLATPILGSHLGWTALLVLLGTCALLQAVAALFLPESRGMRLAVRSELPLRAMLYQAFNRPVLWQALAFALLFSAGTGVNGLVNIYLLSGLGWNRTPALMQAYGATNLIYRLAAALGALLLMRLPMRYLNSLRSYAGFVVVLWILVTPWLLVARWPDQVGLVYLARSLEGIGGGMAIALLLAIAMRVSPKSLEGFTFTLLVAAASFGDLTVGIKTATFFAGSPGRLALSFFTLIPYALASLFFLRPVLKALTAQEALQVSMPPGQEFNRV